MAKFILPAPVAAGNRVLSKPFRCCQLLPFVDCDTTVDGSTWLQSLENELFRLKFHEKNNDLYQFRQVGMYVHKQTSLGAALSWAC